MQWFSDLWQASWQWFTAMDWGCLGAWALTLCLLLGGLVGSVVPLLPGPLLIFIAGVVHTLIRPQSALSWWGLGILFLLMAAAYVADFISGAVGSRWFGGSRWGVAGVLIGGVVGLFFGLPGLILGPIAGGFLFEMLLAKKELSPAMKSTWGTLVGTGMGMAARLAISVAMILVFLVDALWW